MRKFVIGVAIAIFLLPVGLAVFWLRNHNSRRAVSAIKLSAEVVPPAHGMDQPETQEPTRAFLVHALDRFEGSLDDGRSYSVNGHVVYLRRILGVVCTEGDVGNGIHMIVNAHGIYYVIRGVGYRLDFLRAVQSEMGNLFIGGGVPTILEDSEVAYRGNRADGAWLFQIKPSDKEVALQMQVIEDNLMGEGASPAAIAEVRAQLPSYEIVAVTPGGDLKSVAEFDSQNRFLLSRYVLVLGGKANGESGRPDKFSDPKGIDIVPIETLRDFVALIARTRRELRGQ